jgi:hypothetical protein
MRKEVKTMSLDPGLLEQIDALYDVGRDFVETPQAHGYAIEYQFDVCAFDKWRRKVNDLLYSLGGCDDLYYQRFSKEVTRPDGKSLEQGLRILAAVRDDVAAALRPHGVAAGKPVSDGRASVSYH